MVTNTGSKLLSFLTKTTSCAPLAVFRMLFGLLMFVSMIRFWWKGWINEFFISPKYHFSFFGFEWVQPWGEHTYVLFIMAAGSAVLIALGLWYRAASIIFFLSFTYIELMDKTTYLNHYYFISLISFLMIFLPAHACFGLDARNNKNLNSSGVPAWTIMSIKFMVVILYFYAGLAKLNSDWLLKALPMKIWLPAKNDLPLIGDLFDELWVAYAFSWIGCIYDLSIGFLLLYRPTRVIAFLSVMAFHLLTSLLFPIGMFPYIMIFTAMIFFSDGFHEKLLQRIGKALRVSQSFLFSDHTYRYSKPASKFILTIFAFFFMIQLLLPFRYWLYPGELFWTEEGYRFSWRVMLMEKMGTATFVVKDSSGKVIEVNNSEFLTPQQEKMMATQPDMMLEFAHILRDYFSSRGMEDPQVFVDSYVSLNGRIGRPLVKPDVDLAKEKESFKPKYWITPFHDEIKGL